MKRLLHATARVMFLALLEFVIACLRKIFFLSLPDSGKSLAASASMAELQVDHENVLDAALAFKAPFPEM